MIKGLRKAYEMQNKNEPFGQIDIDGLFAGLLRREFIDAKTIIVKGEIMVMWYIISAGKQELVKPGFGDQSHKIN